MCVGEDLDARRAHVGDVGEAILERHRYEKIAPVAVERDAERDLGCGCVRHCTSTSFRVEMLVVAVRASGRRERECFDGDER